MDSLGLGSLPERSLQEAVPEQMDNSELFNFLVEMLMDNWRRTGEVGGGPVSSEPEAFQLSVQLAMSQLQQMVMAQQTPLAGGMDAMPQPEANNPLLAALRGGIG